MTSAAYVLLMLLSALGEQATDSSGKDNNGPSSGQEIPFSASQTSEGLRAGEGPRGGLSPRAGSWVEAFSLPPAPFSVSDTVFMRGK